MMDATFRNQFDRHVLSRLRALGRRLRLYLLLDGLAVVTVAVLAAILVTFLVDRTFWLPRDMRIVQLSTLLLALAAMVWWWVIRPLRAPIHQEQLAVLVERLRPELGSRLVSAVEFARVPVDPSRRSPALVEAVTRQAQEQAADLRFTDTLAHRRVWRRAGLTMGCLLVAGVVGWLSQDTARLWFQRNVLLSNVEWPLRNRLTVMGLTDGRLVVPRGDDASIRVAVDPGYEAPRQVFIDYQGDRGLRGRQQMPAVEGDPSAGLIQFIHTFERIDENLHCRVIGGDARTDFFIIEVVDRPRISDLVIGIKPPAYTGLDAYELRPGQTVAEALSGSEIQFRVHTSKPVVQSVLVRQSAGEEHDLGPAQPLGGQEFLAVDLPETTSSYYFRLADRIGLSNVSERSQPVRFSVRLVNDQPPKVRMRIRGVGEMITPDAILPIEMDFSDTYGIAAARLVYQLGSEQRFDVALKALEPNTKTFAHTLDWLATRRRVAEGERITFHAEAEDLDDINGPNLGESPPVLLRVVSREELLAELNRREQEYRQEFERIIRQQEELYSDLLSLSEPGASENQDRSRRFTRLARQQRDYGGRINTLTRQFEQILSELRINQLTSPAVEARLTGGVIDPLARLNRARVPAAADALEYLSRVETPDQYQVAALAQDRLLADMQRILANMLKWEGFQEAVALLREVMKMQGDLSQETEKRIEAAIFGTEDTGEPSNN